MDDLVRMMLETEPGKVRETVAAEVLAHSPGELARKFFAVLRKRPTEWAVENIIRLMGRLSCDDDRWERIVEKSLRKHGRCPRPLRERLRDDAFGRPAPSGGVRSVPLRDEVEESHAEAVSVDLYNNEILRLSTDATNLRGVGSLIDALHRIRRRRRLKIDLESVDHLYLPGLVVLASWCRKHRVTPVLLNPTPLTERYLDRIGFLEAVREGAEVKFGLDDATSYYVAIADVAFREPEYVSNQIVRICDEHGFLGSESRNALTIAFAELIENVARHAGPEAPGFVAAQLYPQRKKLTIAVADTGMGIRKSFEQGRNLDAIRRIDKGESALDLAVSPLVTSKPVVSRNEPGHAGYGLYVVSSLAIRNGGTFRLTSGGESLTLYRRYHGESWRARSERESHAPWQGTLVSMILDLEYLLPIDYVYASLPPPVGYEDVDFFG